MAHYYLSICPRDYDIQGTIYRCLAGQVLALSDAEHAAVQHEAFPHKRDLAFQGSDTIEKKKHKKEEPQSLEPAQVSVSNPPDPASDTAPATPAAQVTPVASHAPDTPAVQTSTEVPKNSEDQKATPKASKSQSRQH